MGRKKIDESKKKKLVEGKVSPELYAKVHAHAKKNHPRKCGKKYYLSRSIEDAIRKLKP
jgi:prefoldin subunit 5